MNNPTSNPVAGITAFPVTNEMKAIVYHENGSPDVLKLEEVERPSPTDDEVLLKVHAASVNAWDWGLLRGRPFLARIGVGFLKPKNIKILGCDIAGRVEAVGSNVKLFQPGDEVFGDISGCGWGGFAEYVCARENALVLKPSHMTFDEAAAMPQAAVLALQGLRYKEQIQPGQKVLINGAGGGAGTFAVQIAKSFGAEVTGVDSTSKLDMMRTIGADHVIDYTQEDFTQNGQRYDRIVDMTAQHSTLDYKRASSPKGSYAVIGGSTPSILQAVFLGSWIARFGGKKMGLVVHQPNKDLAFVIELFEARKVVPVIDRRFPISEVPEALQYFGEGNAQGKIVITM